MSQGRPTNFLRYALEGMFVTASGDIVLKILSLLSTFFVLQNLAPYDYGIWRLLLSALTAFALLGFSGVTGMFTADVSREMGEGRMNTASGLLYRIAQYFTATSFLASIGLFAAAPLISMYSGINLTLYLHILAATLLFAGARQTYQIFFQASMRPFHAQLFKNITSVIYLAGVAALVVVAKLGLLGLVIAYTVSVIVPVFIYAPYVIRAIAKNFNRTSISEYSFKKALFGRGKWAIAEDYASTLNSSLWPWITGYFLSISTVGMISLALMLLSQISSLIPIQYVFRSILPRLVSDAGRVGEWIVRGMRYTVWAHVVGGLGVAFAASVLFPVVIPNYVSATPIFTAFLLMLPFTACSIVLTEWFYAHKHQKEFFVVNVIPIAILLPLLPVFLHTLGLFGFVCWYALNPILTFMLSTWYIRRYSGISLRLGDIYYPDNKDEEFLSGLARKGLDISKRFFFTS
jgi:O-antigen/teichoic acid export membrane protein